MTVRVLIAGAASLMAAACAADGGRASSEVSAVVQDEGARQTAAEALPGADPDAALDAATDPSARQKPNEGDPPS